MFQNSYRYFQDNSVSKLITILSYVFKPTRVLYRCWWQNFIISRWGENVVIKIRKFSFTLFVTNIFYQHLLPTFVTNICYQHHKYFLDITSALMHHQEFGDFKIHIPIKNLRSEPFSLKWGASSWWSSLYCPMRNSAKMTFGKGHSTLYKILYLIINIIIFNPIYRLL